MNKLSTLLKGEKLPLALKWVLGSTLSGILGYSLYKFFKPRPKNSLFGKSNLGVVITGGTASIGLAFVREFLALGHRVVSCSRTAPNLEDPSNSQKLDVLKHKNFFYMQCDCTKEDDVKKFTTFAKDKLGNIDVFIANVGSGSSILTRFDEISLEHARESIEGNLWSSILCCRNALEVLKSQEFGGHFFFMTGYGASGEIRNVGFSMLGANKCAIHYLSNAVKFDMSSAYPLIGIHSICPGAMFTDSMKKHMGKTSSTADDSARIRILNLIADSTENLSAYITPKICSIEGTGNHLYHVNTYSSFTIRNILLGKIFSSYKKNRFFNEEPATLK